jgi:chromosome segregation ATPase
MDLPKLEDLIQLVIKYNGYRLNYVRVADAKKLLAECRRLQRIERMCQEKTEHIADQSGEIERLQAELEQAHNAATIVSNLLLDRLNKKSDEIQRLMTEVNRLRIALGEYGEKNHWGHTDVRKQSEDWFIPSFAREIPGWQIAEEALKHA